MLNNRISPRGHSNWTFAPGGRFVGHPVNVATGTVYLQRVDCSFLAPIMLDWQRTYSTVLIGTEPCPLGTGWICKYFATLVKFGHNWIFGMPEGGSVTFRDPLETVEKGSTIRDFGSSHQIRREEDQYVIMRWYPFEQRVERFSFSQTAEPGRMRLAAIEDVGRRGLQCHYDSDRLTLVRQRGARRALAIAYNREQRVESVSLVTPDLSQFILARFEYDREGNLVAAYDAAGNADTYDYDKHSCLIRESLKDGAVFTFEYDARSRCTRTSGKGRFDEKTLKYRDEIGWTEVTDSLGATTRYQWNAAGQVVCEISPAGGVIRSEYDPHGRLLSSTDTLGAKTVHEYDEAGNRAATSNAVGKRFSARYNEEHQPIEVTDLCGYKWKCDYDSRHLLSRTTDPAGGVWEFSYSVSGYLTSVKEPRGGKRSWVYDESGCIIESTDWLNNPTRYQRDPLGRIVGRTDALGNTTRFDNDVLGRVTAIRAPDGTQLRCQYDNAGNLASITDGKGRRWLYKYGSCRRLIERSDPAGNRVRYHWGTEPGRLLRIINAAGQSYEFEYDAAGRKVVERGFDDRITRYAYDSAGRVQSITNASGDTVTYQRDALGNVIQETLPDGSISTFEYDDSARLVRAQNAVSDVRLTRDFIGRVIREGQTNGTVETKFDSSGNPVSISDGTFTADLQYDLNRLLTAVSTDGHTITVSRNSLGLESKRSFSGGTALIIEHDPCARVRRQKFLSRQSRNVFGSREYHYDAGADLVAVNDDVVGSLRYAYDQGTRPVQCDRPDGSEAYTYDVMGNIVRSQENGHPEEYEYANGRLIKGAGVRYFYDADGRLVRKLAANGAHEEEWRFVWDAKDQLRGVEGPGGVSWVYEYDALGRRIQKRNVKSATRYLWSRQALFRELSDGSNSRNWVISNSTLEPICFTEREGTLGCVVTDQVGAAWAVIDSAGELAWAARYRIWGRADTRIGSNTRCTARWRGQFVDEETGLHYNRFRYYDPDAGRFISQDPIRVGGGLNLYGFSPNPLLWPDPFGLQNGADCVGGGADQDEDTVPLYRAVSPAELADIQATGAFNPSPVGSEGKYFSTTPEGAMQYAQMVGQTPLNEGPYTLVQTSIPASAVTPEMQATVDRGIPTLVVPNDQLSKLTPPVMVGPIPPS